MSSNIFRETSPLDNRDCFVVFERQKTSFTFPIHIHPEYELNYVEGAKGAHRIVGNSKESIGEQDLVLIANPKLKHAWLDGDSHTNHIHEITLQFHAGLIDEFLDKKQFASVKNLLERASCGLAFGQETIERVLPLLRVITLEKEGFYSVMKFLIVLYELSKSKDNWQLSSSYTAGLSETDLKLQRLQEFIGQNIQEELSIQKTADFMNMSVSTLSRFLKEATQMTYSDYLMDYKINMAIRMLKEEELIPDIVQRCGFNSVSYFYRSFKKHLDMTPAEYRSKFQKKRMIV